MPDRGKKYQDAAKLVDRERNYPATRLWTS